MSPTRQLAMLGVLLVAGPLTAADPFVFPEAHYGKGELKYIHHIPVLTVSGSPREMGEAVGVLAVKPARKMTRYPQDMVKHYHLQSLWRFLVNAGKKMVADFPADYREEFEAMAAGSHVDRDRLAAGNTLFDLKKFLACSALLADAGRSATGAPLLGRNLDYPSLGYAHEFSLVTVYRPDGKHAFAAVGFPGLIGCLSGINDAGLSLAILEVFQVKWGKRWFDASGTPYALCYRRILEECSTIAEAKTLLEKMKRTTTTNLVLADRQGVAVFEVTPDFVIVRRPREGTVVCTNHFCSKELSPCAPINYFHTFERFHLLSRDCQRQGKLTPADLHRSLHAVCVTEETLQTMVFEPGALRLHLAIGTCPSSAGEMKVLNLGPLFQLCGPGGGSANGALSAPLANRKPDD